jgi:hypothetical protein
LPLFVTVSDAAKLTVQSPSALRKAFSHAHQALAEYYHERLKESWLKKDTDKASRELRAALANLERSIMWYGAEVEEKVAVIIKELRALGERVVQKSGSIEEEINKAIKEIEEEFNNLLGRNTEGDNKR